MTLRAIIVLAIAATLCALAMPLRAADTQPNILYVVADDLGWADVGFHGSKIKTPNIDRLCREGIERTRPTLRLRLQQPQ